MPFADATWVAPRYEGRPRSPREMRLTIEKVATQLCNEAGTPRKTLSRAAVSLLAALSWRDAAELRAAIARLLTVSASSTIQVKDVLAHVRFDVRSAHAAPAGTLRSARRQFERDYVALVLRHHHGRVGDAARALGIQRTNLYRKARQLGISVARPSAESQEAPGDVARHPSTDARTE